MTDLSPQAQAIIDAADEVFSNGGTIRDGFASALRVLVIQLKYNQSCWDEPVEHMVLDARAILDIAKELEVL